MILSITSSRIRSDSFFLAACASLLLLLLLLDPAHAAHSRKRVVVSGDSGRRPVYDRVLTDFSPEGRLSQVEYGLEAARKGSTIVAAVLPQGVCWMVQEGSTSSNTPSFGKVHRLDHHMWLVTAGVSGDARTLAQQLRRYCQQHRLQYGETPTSKQVAEFAGSWQHQLTLSGGVRPLGCTALVIGLDEGGSTTPMVYQTDPGGVVERVESFCAAGKSKDAVAKPMASLLEELQGKANTSKPKSSTGNKQEASKTPGKTGKSSKKSTSVSLVHSDLVSAAAAMAQTVLQKLDDPKKVDVWIMHANPQQRGGMESTCYRRISKDNVSKIGKE